MTQTANPLRHFFRQPAIYLRLPSNGNFWPEGDLAMPQNRELPVLPMTAIDEITSISVNILTEDKYLPSSTDIHITFHRPLLIGKVTGTAKIIKLGKQIVSIEGKLFTSNGKIAASGLHTAILTRTSNIKSDV